MSGADTRMFDTHALAMAAGVQRRALDAAKSVWISANAGTGKTEVLTQRMLALLLGDGTLEPKHLLALTFTKAGAAEMAARLPERLEAWAKLDEADLAAEVQRTLGLEVAQVGERVKLLAEQVRRAPPLVATIHALAQQLLGRFAVEAGFEPGFEVLEEGAQRRLLMAVQHRLLVGVDGPLAESLAVLLDELGEHGWRDATGLLVREWRRLQERLEDGGAAGVLARVKEGLGLDVRGPSSEVRSILPDEAAWAALRRVAAAVPGHAAAEVLKAGEMGLEAAWRSLLLTDKNTPRARLFLKAEAAKLDEADVALLAAAAERVAEAVRLRAVWRGYAVTEALVIWAAAVKAAYAAEKRARGVADYDDLLDGLERLLRRADEGLAAWLWYGFDRRFRHMVVDEGQDNNPQQDRIVQWLARNILSGDVGEDRARTVLAVGDVKQSIFRFQGAAPEMFVQLREALGTWAQSDAFVEVDLTHSFRSGPEILALVDAVFDREGLPEMVQGEARGWPGHRAVAAVRPSRVELWPLVPPPPKADVEPWALPQVRAEAGGDGADIRLLRQVAAWLADRLGRVVMPSTGTPLRAEDVLLVVQTNKVAGVAAGILRAAGLPVAATGGIVPVAVQDVAALVRVVFNSEDNLALAQVLKAFRAWDDARLLALAARAGKGVWAEHLEGADRAWLEAWRARAHDAPLAVVHAAMAARGGARGDFEGLLGWAAACASLRELVMRCEQEDIPVSGDGVGIRIMTVQKAKGLQAPLVILPETLRGGQVGDLLWGEGVMLYKQRKGLSTFEDGLLAEEEARLEADALRGLYVALTRASDWLVVAGFGDKKEVGGTWWGRVEAAGGWREEGGVKVRGADFAMVEKAVAVEERHEVPAWMGAPLREVEAAEPQTPAQVRGELVHALLQGLAVPAEVGVVAEVEGVKAALPWVFAGGRSEVDVALAGGAVGRIDRLVEHEGVVWVIDFKTGEVVAPLPPAYIAQVQGYVAAVQAGLPGKPVRGAVVWTATATLAPVA